MARLIDALLGCSHNRTTFPFTIKTGQQSDSQRQSETYIVCLDCGKEFPYDWHAMKFVSRLARRDKSAKKTPQAA